MKNNIRGKVVIIIVTLSIISSCTSSSAGPQTPTPSNMAFVDIPKPGTVRETSPAQTISPQLSTSTNTSNEIIYVCYYDYSDICSVSSTGNNFTNLTNDQAHDHTPKWSPDGNRIAYLSGPGSDESLSYLVLMNPDGSNKSVFSDTGIYILDFDWSYDSKYIAFTKYEEGKPSQIFVVDLEAQTVKLLTSGSQPKWFPKNHEIAFVAENRIDTIMMDGTNRRNVITNGLEYVEYNLSPDGSRIALTAMTTIGNVLFIALADGSSKLNQIGSDVFFTAPKWSPDGKMLAFTTLPAPLETDNNNIIVCEVSQVQCDVKATIDPKLGFARHLDWSSNGVGFVVDTMVTMDPMQPGIFELYSMNYEGSDLAKLTSDKIAGAEDPDWRP